MRGWKNIMENESSVVDKQLLREMFYEIRNAEIKNVKTGKWDDKQMTERIMKYICNKIEGNK